MRRNRRRRGTVNPQASSGGATDSGIRKLALVVRRQVRFRALSSRSATTAPRWGCASWRNWWSVNWWVAFTLEVPLVDEPDHTVLLMRPGAPDCRPVVDPGKFPDIHRRAVAPARSGGRHVGCRAVGALL